MKSIILTIALALSVTAARADTYTYACKVEDGPRTHLYSAVLDTGKHTLTWRGKTYRHVVDISTKRECGKACFGSDEGAMLDIATQGVATLTISYGTKPGEDGAEFFDCDRVNK